MPSPDVAAKVGAVEALQVPARGTAVVHVRRKDCRQAVDRPRDRAVLHREQALLHQRLEPKSPTVPPRP